jgi:hypothetical protein
MGELKESACKTLQKGLFTISELKVYFWLTRVCRTTKTKDYAEIGERFGSDLF